MRAMRFAIAAVMLAVSLDSARAAFVTQVSEGSFAAQVVDDFESYTSGGLYSILGGNASLSGGGGTIGRQYGEWGMNTKTGTWQNVVPHDGRRFGVLGDYPGTMTITFNTPVMSFGGYFGDVSQFGLTTFDFYDSGSSLIGSYTLDLKTPADSTLVWAGFSATVQIARLDITGYQSPFDTLMISSQQQGATVTPEPTSLALAGFAGIGMAVGALRRRRQEKQAA